MIEVAQAMEVTHCGSNMFVGTLTCALLYSVCDLKAAQMNISLIQELMLYHFKFSHDSVEAIKSICYTKGYSNKMVEEILFR